MKEIVIKDLQNVIEDIKNENVDGVIDFIKLYKIMDSWNPMCTLVKQIISDKIKDFMVQNNKTKLCMHTQHGECNHYDHYNIEENGDLIVSGFMPGPLTDNSLSKAYRGYKYIQRNSDNHENN